jgi:hypothetical protein
MQGVTRHWWRAVPVSQGRSCSTDPSTVDRTRRTETVPQVGGHALLPPSAPPRGKRHAARGPCGPERRGQHGAGPLTRNPLRVTLLLQVKSAGARATRLRHAG